MSTAVIDPNVRVRNNWTVTGFEGFLGGLPEVGDEVTVVEVESGVVGVGWVRELHRGQEIVYLEVDWASLHRPKRSA